MRKIDIDTFLSYDYVSDPKYSPDGKYVAFLVAHPDLQGNTYEKNIYIYDVQSCRLCPMTSCRNIGIYLWISENEIVFSDNSHKAGNPESLKEQTALYRQNIHWGEAVYCFSLDGQVRFADRLSDGRLVVAANTYAHDRKKDEAYEVIEEVPFWANGGGYSGLRRTGIYLVDLGSRTSEKITDRFEDCLFIHVWRDKVLYTSLNWTDVRPQKPALKLYDGQTSITDVLIGQDTMYIGPALMIGPKESIFAGSRGETWGMNQYMDFYKISVEDKQICCIKKYGYSIGNNTVGTDVCLGGGTAIKALGRKVYFVSTVDESAFLYCLDEEGKLSGPLTGEGSCDSFDVYGEHVAVCGFYADDLAQIYIDGKRVTDFNSHLKDYSIMQREPVEMTASDGEKVRGFVIKPSYFQRDQKYPALLYIHGGPRTVFGSIFHHEMQVLANRGYFVFYCNPRGSDGRGNDFGCIDGHFGTVDYTDLMEFTDRVMQEYPQIDKERLGVLGGSYGGFMTNWIIGHTDRFRAAVSMRSVSNWISMEFMSDIGHFFVPLSMGTSAFEDVSPLWEQSPLKYASYCKTPTLFIHSQEDYRCPLTEGMQMFSALKLVGCETRLCVIKGENHELSRSGRPSRRIRRMKEIISWLDRYLKSESSEERQG